MVKHISRLLIFEDNETVSALVESTLNLLVQDHFTQLHQHALDGERYLIGHVVDLNLGVGQNDLLEIVLQQVVVQEVEMAPDDHVVEELALIGRGTLLEG